MKQAKRVYPIKIGCVRIYWNASSLTLFACELVQISYFTIHPFPREQLSSTLKHYVDD